MRSSEPLENKARSTAVALLVVVNGLAAISESQDGTGQLAGNGNGRRPVNAETLAVSLTLWCSSISSVRSPTMLRYLMRVDAAGTTPCISSAGRMSEA
jgi:hypothetical protein